MSSRVDPSRMPRLDAEVVAESALRETRVGANAFSIQGTKRLETKATQHEQVGLVVQERARYQIRDLEAASLHTEVVRRKEADRTAKRKGRKEREAATVDQLRVAILAGENVDSVLEPLLKRAKKGQQASHHQLTAPEHEQIIELCAKMNQKAAAARLGVSTSTISRHVHRPVVRTDRRGAPQKLTEDMVFAGARFLFFFKHSTWEHCATFIRRTFDVDVSTKTVASHVKNKAGFRHNDFRRFPLERNSDAAIESRYQYARELPTKYGPGTLANAIYYGKMCITKNLKTRTWAIVGWCPSIGEETRRQNSGIHISLLFAASPTLGVIHYEVLAGSVTGNDVLAFFQAMVTSYCTKFPTACKAKRALIMDNVCTDHAEALVAYLQGDVMQSLFGIEYFPQQSPFLNPLEEVFAYLKRTMWRRRAEDTQADESRSLLIKLLTEMIATVDTDLLKRYSLHTEAFLGDAREKQPIGIQQMHGSSPMSDEVGTCPRLPEKVELLLNSALPAVYDAFTAAEQALVEMEFGVKRLTMDFVEKGIHAPCYRPSHDTGLTID